MVPLLYSPTCLLAILLVALSTASFLSPWLRRRTKSRCAFELLKGVYHGCDVFLIPAYHSGPPSHHWLLGNIPLNIGVGSGYEPKKWFETYGHTFRTPMALQNPTFTSIDPAALTFISKNPDIFPKQSSLRRQLARYMDEGLVVAEGIQHSRQRKALSSSFALNQIKRYHSQFMDVTQKLGTRLDDQFAEKGFQQRIEVDILSWTLSWR